MNFKKRILVFPCGSEIGLEIHNALQYSSHVQLIGGSSVDDHGRYVYKEYIGGIPYSNKPNFIPYMNNIIKKHNIDAIYPAHDDVLYLLAMNKQKIKSNIIGPRKTTAKICRFKSTTYNYFQNILPVPKIYRDVNDITKYPVFLKPNSGQGTRGTFLAESVEDINFYLKKDPTLLILEYLPGIEYTIDCFTSRHGKLLFVGPRIRGRIQNGISVNTRPVKGNKLFSEYAALINNNLNLRGAWFFQLKRDKNRILKLMEISQRIAGSMALYRNLGVNFELLTIFDYYNIDVEIIINKYKIELDRALANKFKINIKYKYVYIDFDDCLFINNKINTKIIAFCYQCLNENKKIILITRHREPIIPILKKYKLYNIFFKIYQISKTESKSSYCYYKPAIFIDDSFSERTKVLNNTNITVFDLDLLECLIK